MPENNIADVISSRFDMSLVEGFGFVNVDYTVGIMGKDYLKDIGFDDFVEAGEKKICFDGEYCWYMFNNTVVNDDDFDELHEILVKNGTWKVMVHPTESKPLVFAGEVLRIVISPLDEIENPVVVTLQQYEKIVKKHGKRNVIRELEKMRKRGSLDSL